MIELISDIIICFAAGFFFWFGWEIYRGNKRWYRLVAGNLFHDSDDSVARHHKGLGIFYLCFGLFVLTMLFWS